MIHVHAFCGGIEESSDLERHSREGLGFQGDKGWWTDLAWHRSVESFMSGNHFLMSS